METDSEITEALWDKLRSDRTVMLGLEQGSPPTLRPMTAQIDAGEDHGPIWFFTSTDSTLAAQTGDGARAIFTFASAGHDVFATVHGRMSRSTDRAVIDRLWNMWVAAWYEGGKTDPDLVLLRFDPSAAEIWRNGSNLIAGLKVLFGGDPKDDYKDQVVRVTLS